ncbi:uncharacterized protein LOC121739727 [Aricia agestis]|uniref:uncharacterized protein LOC121739727 n=1 Tax=Aricia agestis TaxID=91739 RepID=UPI001C20AD27|nr:uncharacterized protein LOC121739727 [Aricia agestis]
MYERDRRLLSIIFSTLLLGRAIAGRGASGVRVELRLERWAARGGSVRLRCEHDVPPHLLDKVVFLRAGTKIFQYIRDRKPPYRNFTTPGAVVNVALATENSIVLQNLEAAASDVYSCEVSLHTPIYTKASSEKQLTVFQPQKHNPRVEFPRRRLHWGETLRVSCTSAPAAPAPHITWFVNGNKMNDLIAYSHQYRVPERRGPRPEPPPVLSLSHASHAATRAPGCAPRLETEALSQSTVGGRRRARAGLFVAVSELQLVASGRLEVACVSTIPEFRSIHDTFADMRNDTVIVEVLQPSVSEQQQPHNLTAPTSSAGRPAAALALLAVLHAALS